MLDLNQEISENIWRKVFEASKKIAFQIFIAFGRIVTIGNIFHSARMVTKEGCAR